MEQTRQRVVGVILLAAAALAGRETLVWAWGRFLDFITGANGRATLTGIPWQNAAAALLALFGIYLLRPSRRSSKPDPFAGLWPRAENIVGRIREQRNRGRFLQIAGGEPLADVVRDGASTLLLFEKAGLHVPMVNEMTSAERIAIALEHYFSSMAPLLRDGHRLEALHAAATTSAVALQKARNFKLQNWSDDPYAGF